nr:hypothetical protein [Desulfobacterales bacterium]
MTVSAVETSNRLELPVLSRTITCLNHSRGIITTGTIRSRNTKGEFIKDPMPFVSLPAVSRLRHKALSPHAQRAKEMTFESSFKTVPGKGDSGIAQAE